jgi:hypothetical protein
MYLSKMEISVANDKHLRYILKYHTSKNLV